MISKEDIQTIEKEARELFTRLGEAGDVRVDQDEEGQTVTVHFKAEDPKILIGERGQTLFEIQHILKLIIRKKLPDLGQVYISLDVNEYKKNKEEYLRDLAITTADEVTLLKKAKELSPMASSERRIIHTALADRSDVVSESIGEGVERRIVIKPKE